MSQALNQQCNEYFGYKHFTKEKVPRCFYVGKGKIKRPYQLKGRNKKHLNVVAKYGCNVVVCIGPASNNEICEWEKQEIEREQTYHYSDISGIGCNFTLGGEGTPGSHHNLGRKKPPFSDEHRLALKIARQKQDMTKHAKTMSNLVWMSNPTLKLTKRFCKLDQEKMKTEGWILGRIYGRKHKNSITKEISDTH